jgi:SpoVK/Ycf46/Vps4 family AAA+-type ATPase
MTNLAGLIDRRVAVSPPDLTGRRQILAVHSRDVPLAPDVDLEDVAASTTGMVGADLANLVNEAALLAARRGHDRVNVADFADALEKILQHAGETSETGGRPLGCKERDPVVLGRHESSSHNPEVAVHILALRLLQGEGFDSSARKQVGSNCRTASR